MLWQSAHSTCRFDPLSRGFGFDPSEPTSAASSCIRWKLANGVRVALVHQRLHVRRALRSEAAPVTGEADLLLGTRGHVAETLRRSLRLRAGCGTARIGQPGVLLRLETEAE